MMGKRISRDLKFSLTKMFPRNLIFEMTSSELGKMRKCNGEKRISPDISFSFQASDPSLHTSGLPSTAGSTTSIGFIRRRKIYIGHVGDSANALGVQEDCSWRCEPLTRDHKPESVEESRRIQQCGGKVVCKSGVSWIVWNRPKMGPKGPVRMSTLPRITPRVRNRPSYEQARIAIV